MGFEMMTPDAVHNVYGFYPKETRLKILALECKKLIDSKEIEGVEFIVTESDSYNGSILMKLILNSMIVASWTLPIDEYDSIMKCDWVDTMASHVRSLQC